MVEEVGPDVSTGLFIALTMGEREKRKVEVKVTDGREGGGRRGMKDHCNNTARERRLWPSGQPLTFSLHALLECNSR